MITPQIIGKAELWDEPPKTLLDLASTYPMDVVRFTSGISLVHAQARCRPPCAIHYPSNHHMRHLPVFYRGDRNMVERRCEHGCGHPDPDQVTYWQESLSKNQVDIQTIHGCCEDRCCVAPEGEDDE